MSGKLKQQWMELRTLYVVNLAVCTLAEQHITLLKGANTMNVYDKTHNGVRYSIWALKTVEHPGGGTDSDCQAATDWTDDSAEALTHADCFRATFNAAPPEDREDWEAVGDYFYDTFDAAVEAVEQHFLERG